MNKKVITYYTIQHRLVGESKWGNPSGKLYKSNGDWSFSSFDSFQPAFNPSRLRGTSIKYVREAAEKDKNKLWNTTGRRGWTQKRFATAAVNSAKKLNEQGEWDSFDSFGTCVQAKRYEFRVVRCYTHFSWEEVK